MGRSSGDAGRGTEAWAVLAGMLLAGCPGHAPPALSHSPPVGELVPPVPTVATPPPSLPPLGEASPEPEPPPIEALEPALTEREASRIAEAAAWLLAEDGPPVRLRLFLPSVEAGGDPAFDGELRAAAEALREATPRLRRVDITAAPFDEAAVTALRGLAVLPREGGRPDAVRCLVVALGERLIPVTDLAPGRGSPRLQLLLALHRVLRGPIRIGAIVPVGDTAGARALAEALPDFALAPVEATDDPLGFAAIVILASGAGPLPAWAAAATRKALQHGRGVVVIGGRYAVRDERGARTVARSASDPTPLLAGTGVSLADGIVVDPACARVSVPAPTGRLFLSYPPFVRTAFTLPGATGRAIAVLPFASPLIVPAGEGVEVLARSSEASWVEPADADWNPSRLFRPGPEPASRVLAAALRIAAPGAGADDGRLVVVSTAGPVSPDTRTLEGNAAVAAGIVAWAAGVEELLLPGEEEEP